MPHPQTWLKPLPAGLYCEPGGFFIDPVRAVDRAVITHAHSDHARPGHRAVLASPQTLALMRVRLGEDGAGTTAQPLGWGERLTMGEVTLWLEPAGHVLGSAQVALEWRGSRAVVSGDYKRTRDPTTPAFVPIACDVFVTEATFALPVFRHPPPAGEIGKLLASVALFPERTHLVGCYSLGKCQRLAALLREAGWERPIFLHGAHIPLCEAYAALGVDLGPLAPATGAAKAALAGAIVLAPPGGGGGSLGAAARRSRGVRRLGLDAGAPARAAGRGRVAAGHFRPRRLGRTQHHHRRGGRPGNLGDAWTGGGADLRGRTARRARAGAAAPRLRRGGRGGMIAFADLLERLVFTPSRNAKIALLRRYFATEPDPDRGIGLAAITGELSFADRQARPDPRTGGGAHRSGAVRLVLRLCRRPRRDRRADVARRRRRAPIRRGWPRSSTRSTAPRARPCRRS